MAEISSIKFYLTRQSDENKYESFQFPVNPPSIKVSSTHGYEDIEVTQLGEITIIGNEKLREISFSSFFPKQYNRSYCEYSNLLDPWKTVKMIEMWMKSGDKLRFIVTPRVNYPTPGIINIPVTIRSFNYEERGGSPGDVYFDITLKEYRTVSFRKLVKKGDVYEVVESGNGRPDYRNKSKYRMVKQEEDGMYLMIWAEKYIKNLDADKFDKLIELNKDAFANQKGRGGLTEVKAGMLLVLPDE